MKHCLTCNLSGFADDDFFCSACGGKLVDDYRTESFEPLVTRASIGEESSSKLSTIESFPSGDDWRKTVTPSAQIDSGFSSGCSFWKNKKTLGIVAIAIAVLIAVILFASFVGRDSVKSEKELMVDLAASPSVCMVEGSRISELSVIKRLTDEDARTDTVYVSVNIEHEAASELRAYVMRYTHYEEGWLLDVVDTYYESEDDWKIVPKAVPTNEEIMDRFHLYSIKVLSENAASCCSNTSVFFEDGKYASEIIEEGALDDRVYCCKVQTRRDFDLVSVTEIQEVTLAFTDSYEWEVVDVYCRGVSGDWFIEGTWEIPEINATLELSKVRDGASYADDDVYEFEEYSFVLMQNGKKRSEGSELLEFPTSLDHGLNRIMGPKAVLGPTLYCQVCPTSVVWRNHDGDCAAFRI